MLARSEKIEWKTYDKCKSGIKKNVDIVCGKVAVCNRAANFSQETIDCLLFKIIIFSSLVCFAGGILTKLLGLVRKWRVFGPKRMRTTHSVRMELAVVQTFNLWQWWCAISGNYFQIAVKKRVTDANKNRQRRRKRKVNAAFPLDTMTASLKAQTC